jgi:hypothetical protein
MHAWALHAGCFMACGVRRALQDAMASWPAMHAWTFEKLAERFGAVQFKATMTCVRRGAAAAKRLPRHSRRPRIHSETSARKLPQALRGGVAAAWLGGLPVCF